MSGTAGTQPAARWPELAEAQAAHLATRFEDVLRLAQPVFHAARDAGRWALAGEAALLIGRARANLPDPADALRWLREATQAARLSGDAASEAAAWLQLAAEHARYEQVAAALQALDEATRLAGQLCEPDRLYPLLGNAAATYYGLGLLGVALGCSRRAMEAAERMDDVAQRLTARTNLLLVGTSLHEQLEPVDAPAAAALAVELDAQLPQLQQEVDAVAQPRAQARAHMVVARTHMACGRWAPAHERLQALLALRVDLPRVLWCSAWLTQARVLRHLGRLDEAREAAGRAEAFADPIRPGEPRTYELRRRSEIAELQGRPEEALALFRQFHERAQHVLASAFEARLAAFNARVEQQELLIENTALRLRQQGLADALQSLERLATTDALTGLLNRRGLDAELAALRLTATTCALAVIDVDHFKHINDTHSHAVGDRVLAQLARCMAQALRQGDRLARLGGEEFVVLMPGSTLAAAQAALERLCQAVRSAPWADIVPGLAVTVSAGLAVGATSEPAEQTLARADAQLYRAKAEGRDRLCVAAPTVAGPL